MSVHWPTLAFQAVNFLVLLALLAKLMFRPLLRHMRARRAKIEGGIAELAARRAELDAAEARLEQADAQARRRAEQIALEARRAAEAERGRILETAREEAAAERDRQLARVAAEQLRAREELVTSLAPLVGRALERLLAELGAPAELHDLACRRMAAALTDVEPRPGPVEVESATGDLPPELERAAERLGLEPGSSSIRRAPDLIAGARLRIGDEVLDGSVRAQIAQALEDPS
jgi:F-type H+-transporting ATPase subunit b